MPESTGTITGKLELYEQNKQYLNELKEQEQRVREANALLEAEIIDDMTEMAERAGLTLADLKIAVGDKQYAATRKQFYSIKADDREAGFPALRNVGLGWLITERVDDRSLTKALVEMAEENGGKLPPSMGDVPLTVYEKPVLSGRTTRRK